MVKCVVAGLLLALAGSAFAAEDSGLLAVVQRYLEAQRNFDQDTLKEVTTENFIEVSPIGEVDPRDKMLTFYTPDQKRSAPQVKVEEPVIRILGDNAVVLARVSFIPDENNPARMFSMRAGYVAQLMDGKWKLVSAQYTGIRAPRN